MKGDRWRWSGRGHVQRNLRDGFVVPDDAVVVDLFGGVEPKREALLALANAIGKDVGLEMPFNLACHGISLVAQELEVHFAVVGICPSRREKLHQPSTQSEDRHRSRSVLINMI